MERKRKKEMIKKIVSVVVSIVAFVILFFLLKHLSQIVDFILWFYLLKEGLSAPITTIQVILIDSITHVLTFLFVGSVFAYFGWWNKNTMEALYVIVSEIISLVLIVLVRLFINYYWILFVVLGLFVIALIVFEILKKRAQNNISQTSD